MPPSTSSRNRRRGGGRFFNWSSRGTRRHPHSNESSQLSLYSSRDLINSPLGVLAASPGMAIFINQAMFFLLCDKIFCPRQRLTGLYSLLFYNVASYLISYGKDIIETRKKYTPYVEVSEQSHVRHLAMSATKIVLDLTKFVTFGITCIFILLVFGVPGHHQFNPTWCYIFTTVVYYVLTEPWTHANATSWLSWLQVELFSNLEVLWAPVLIRLCSSFASGMMIAFVWFISSPSSLLLILTSAYVNVYLCLKEMDKYWRTLIQEKSALDRYRCASSEELQDLADDVCSVCRLPMKRTWMVRATPCHHFFHADCLRLCLKQDNQSCPICKRDLLCL